MSRISIGLLLALLVVTAEAIDVHHGLSEKKVAESMSLAFVEAQDQVQEPVMVSMVVGSLVVAIVLRGTRTYASHKYMKALERIQHSRTEFLAEKCASLRETRFATLSLRLYLRLMLEAFMGTSQLKTAGLQGDVALSQMEKRLREEQKVVTNKGMNPQELARAKKDRMERMARDTTVQMGAIRMNARQKRVVQRARETIEELKGRIAARKKELLDSANEVAPKLVEGFLAALKKQEKDESKALGEAIDAVCSGDVDSNTLEDRIKVASSERVDRFWEFSTTALNLAGNLAILSARNDGTDASAMVETSQIAAGAVAAVSCAKVLAQLGMSATKLNFEKDQHGLKKWLKNVGEAAKSKGMLAKIAQCFAHASGNVVLETMKGGLKDMFASGAMGTGAMTSIAISPGLVIAWAQILSSLHGMYRHWGEHAKGKALALTQLQLFQKSLGQEACVLQAQMTNLMVKAADSWPAMLDYFAAGHGAFSFLDTFAKNLEEGLCRVDYALCDRILHSPQLTSVLASGTENEALKQLRKKVSMRHGAGFISTLAVASSRETEQQLVRTGYEPLVLRGDDLATVLFKDLSLWACRACTPRVIVGLRLLSNKIEHDKLERVAGDAVQRFALADAIHSLEVHSLPLDLDDISKSLKGRKVLADLRPVLWNGKEAPKGFEDYQMKGLVEQDGKERAWAALYKPLQNDGWWADGDVPRLQQRVLTLLEENRAEAVFAVGKTCSEYLETKECVPASARSSRRSSKGTWICPTAVSASGECVIKARVAVPPIAEEVRVCKFSTSWKSNKEKYGAQCPFLGMAAWTHSNLTVEETSHYKLFHRTGEKQEETCPLEWKKCVLDRTKRNAELMRQQVCESKCELESPGEFKDLKALLERSRPKQRASEANVDEFVRELVASERGVSQVFGDGDEDLARRWKEMLALEGMELPLRVVVELTEKDVHNKKKKAVCEADEVEGIGMRVERKEVGVHMFHKCNAKYDKFWAELLVERRNLGVKEGLQKSMPVLKGVSKEDVEAAAAHDIYMLEAMQFSTRGKLSKLEVAKQVATGNSATLVALRVWAHYNFNANAKKVEDWCSNPSKDSASDDYTKKLNDIVSVVDKELKKSGGAMRPLPPPYMTGRR